MDGVLRLRQAERDAALSDAYTTAAFSAAAQVGKLKPLDHYRRKAKSGGVARTPKDMLNAFRQFQANGAPMQIKRIERKSD